MRRVVYFLAASLDGFIARSDGSVDWLKEGDLEEAGGEFMEFASSVDAILFGRKTWEKGLELEPSGESFKGFTNYVFTRNAAPGESNSAVFVNKEPVQFVEELKHKEGKNIWLMGGGQLAATLLNAGLIDDIVISVQPVILGTGIPVFKDADEQLNMKVTDTKTRKSGSVQITYELPNQST